MDVILTGFGSIYTKLKNEGLPVVRLYPNAIQIRQHLDRLIHSVRTRGEIEKEENRRLFRNLVRWSGKKR